MECAHCEKQIPEELVAAAPERRYCSKRCKKRAAHLRWVRRQIKLGTPVGQYREAWRNQRANLGRPEDKG